MTNYTQIESCRIGGGSDLIEVLNLGNQALTGVFPKSKEEDITVGPLQLVWSQRSGLLQLKHSYEAGEMYGDNYGYRSGLNKSMVQHLTRKVQFLERFVDLKPGSAVLDIGSNDCTTLKAYSIDGLDRIGIDPTAGKFAEYYPDDIKMVPDFFSADAYNSKMSKPASIVTSIAMFYDLDDPITFAKEIEQILGEGGVWHFEQSYMPSMLRMNSYDTICHEHIEYYSLSSVKFILESAGLKLVDVVVNNVNGGSFAVTAARANDNTRKVNSAVIDWMLEQEVQMGLNTPKPFRDFEERVFRHRDDLVRLVRALVADGKNVFGYGASTKGNVVLQFCGFDANDITAIAEVNEEKFGKFTPGSKIPIISEAEARAQNPDYFLVLPWHFREGILQREQEYLNSGGRFIFPLPEIEIV